jgi:hypothetical protein
MKRKMLIIISFLLLFAKISANEDILVPQSISATSSDPAVASIPFSSSLDCQACVLGGYVLGIDKSSKNVCCRTRNDPFCANIANINLSSQFHTLFDKIKFCVAVLYGKRGSYFAQSSNMFLFNLFSNVTLTTDLRLKPYQTRFYMVTSEGFWPKITVKTNDTRQTPTLFFNSFSGGDMFKDKASDIYMGTKNYTLNQSVARALPRDQYQLENYQVRLYVTVINIPSVDLGDSEAHYEIEATQHATLIKGITLWMIGLIIIIFS